MQLTKSKKTSFVKPSNSTKIKNIGSALAAATCGVLGVASTSALAQGEPGTWDFDTAILGYSETEDRVVAIEPVFSATRNYADGKILNLKAVFDSLTGASPNGATPSDQPQTFTTPSGNGTYITAAGDTPIDDTFKDTRVALSATWTSPLVNRDWEYTAGVYGSGEYDYFSVGASGALKRYLNDKNTALNVGLSFSSDTLDPEGNVPVPLSEMPHKGSPGEAVVRSASRAGSDDDKTIVDLLLGVTQVINRQTIMQFNYSLSVSDGYLNDPFKVLSVIDATPGVNFGGNLTDANGNIYLYEARPDSRTKHSLFWQTKYALENGDVIDGSYRFMVDDWGINSHTFDFRYRWDLGGSYLEPHVRYYLQSEADFYKRFIGEGEYNGGTPTFKEASADERLSDIDAITFGAKYGWKLKSGNEVNMRVEYYLQSHSGDDGFGKLAAQDLFPDNEAIIFQVGYSF